MEEYNWGMIIEPFYYKDRAHRLTSRVVANFPTPQMSFRANNFSELLEAIKHYFIESHNGSNCPLCNMERLEMKKKCP